MYNNFFFQKTRKFQDCAQHNYITVLRSYTFWNNTMLFQALMLEFLFSASLGHWNTESALINQYAMHKTINCHKT